MTLEEAVWVTVTADDAVGGLIGARLYPELIPQDAGLPAMAYQRISRAGDVAHDGPVGLATARVQFSIVAATYGQKRTIMAGLRRLFDGKRGRLPPGAAADEGVMVYRSAIDGEGDGYLFSTRAQSARVDVVFHFMEV